MLIPHQTLARLSPTAAKIYLALLVSADLAQSPPTITLSLAALTRLTSLKERTCAYALRQLRALGLLQSFRRGKNAPCTYRLIAHDLHLHAAAPMTCNPMHPHDLHEIAAHPSNTRDFSPKTHDLQSPAALLRNLLDPNHPLASDDPELLASLFNQLTDAEKQVIIAQAQSVLATPPAEAHP